MTKFTDGPAAGKILPLARMPMPLFLRVVKDGGDIDALDQADDEPKAGEELFAYRKASSDGTVHVDGRDKNGKRFGRWYESCTYALCDNQPSQEVMRGTDSWREWCMANATAEQKKG